MHILGLDPGIANTGVAIFEFHDSLRVSGALLIETTPRLFSKSMYVSDDSFIRARLFSKELLGVIGRYLPDLICMEGFSPLRSASVSSKNAMIYGVVASLSDCKDIPVCLLSPKAVRDAIFGSDVSRKEITKDVIKEKVCQIFPDFVSFISVHKKAKHEHLCDAAAVVIAAQQTDYFKLLARREC